MVFRIPVAADLSLLERLQDKRTDSLANYV